MSSAGGLSIVARITCLNMLVTSVTLALAAGALGLYDRTSFREATVWRLSTQAQIVGANSVSALLFNDPGAAEVTLTALGAAPRITAAEIYGPDGRVFAAYRRDDVIDGSAPILIPAGQAETHRFEAQQIVVARRIVSNGKPAGSVVIRSDLQELNARRAQFLSTMAAVLTASLVAALVISWLAQGAISRPIIRLATIARTVSERKDYSLRAPSTGKADEIGVLTDALNEMLTQIQQRDISLHEAQHALDARVQERTAELSAGNRELEAFTYSVSHDLRAPLRHVIGFAGLLEERALVHLDAQSQRYLQTITEAAKRLAQLIDDLLAFSRMGRNQLVKGPVSLNQLVHAARHEATLAGSPASAEIDWRVGDLPDVEGDPAMLRLVMVNLISNAVKYTSSRPRAAIEVGATVDATEVVVCVRDNGVGFDMEYAHKLFGVFQRLHSTEEFEGTGIGLANVRQIINRHGGRVWCEGERDRGATFYFSLPTRERHT